jgi:hypothetical protein
LDLIADQENIVFLAECVDLGEVTFIGDDDTIIKRVVNTQERKAREGTSNLPSLTLDGFDKEGSDVLSIKLQCPLEIS